jgi:Spy/CpxP family protein refolding chaperone
MNKTWHVVLAFLVVFVAGGAIGSVYELQYGPRLPAPRALPRPEQFNAQLARRWMNNQLNLTPAQRQKILPVINGAAEDMRRLRTESTHNGELIMDRMYDDISAVLNPAQRIRFDNLVNAARERMKEFNLQQQIGGAGKKGPVGQGQGAREGN